MSQQTKITCQICGEAVHHIGHHLSQAHPDRTLASYQSEYPDAPLVSKAFEAAQEKKRQEEATGKGTTNATASMNMQAQVLNHPAAATKQVFAKVFQLGDAPAAKNARNEDIMCTVLGNLSDEIAPFVPAQDRGYIFDINLLKDVMMAMELKMPLLLHGLHGSGKTTIIQQFCHYTNRPAIRVQHTVSTEEAHILGQYIVKDGETQFQLGPLPYAMKHGLVYIADEYDFALPAVIAAYQPVLEGEPLLIKDAPMDMRKIVPHENFRFVATGNTNGCGDETGLYQGTNIQNAAAYSRFAVTKHVEYMDADQEIMVVQSQAGVQKADAKRLVKIATRIRDEFRAGQLSMTISPRELINAAKLGIVKGSDWAAGLHLAYINRLGTTDREAVQQFVQREFGGA